MKSGLWWINCPEWDDAGSWRTPNRHMILAQHYCRCSVLIKKLHFLRGHAWPLTFRQEVPPPPPPPPPFVLMKPLGGSGKPWNWMPSIPSKPPPPLQSQRAWTKPCSASCTLQDPRRGLWLQQMSWCAGSTNARPWSVSRVALCGLDSQAEPSTCYQGQSSAFPSTSQVASWLKVLRHKNQEIDSLSDPVGMTKSGICSHTA